MGDWKYAAVAILVVLLGIFAGFAIKYLFWSNVLKGAVGL